MTLGLFQNEKKQQLKKKTTRNLLNGWPVWIIRFSPDSVSDFFAAPRLILVHLPLVLAPVVLPKRSVRPRPDLGRWRRGGPVERSSGADRFGALPKPEGDKCKARLWQVKLCNHSTGCPTLNILSRQETPTSVSKGLRSRGVEAKGLEI